MKIFEKSVLPAIIILAALSLQACNREVYDEFTDTNLHVLHEKTYQISPGKELKLEGSSGDITVTTWDKPEVYVKILGNERAKQKIEFYFDSNNDRVEIIAKNKSFWNSGSGIKMQFEIKIPSSFNPDLYTSGGDIRIAGVKGNVSVKTSGGDVSAKYINGQLKVSTSGGDIKLEDTKGKTSAETSGGDITANEFNGTLHVSTSGGDIKLDGENADIDASTSGGSIELRYSGENKGINLDTSGGDISVYLPSDFNAAAYLSSSGGDVNCELPANNVKTISSSKFEANINNGGKQLVAKTSGGSVDVHKR
jgi:DUF4097 and DUF4098 domain-containing protein YvlB